MPGQQLTLELDAQDLKVLQELAEHERRSIEDIVALAVKSFIAHRTIDHRRWQRRWDNVIAGIRSGVPEELTPEEIEAEVRAARGEYREQWRARNG